MEHPDPILLVAQTCCPHLLSLDDLLAIRRVCKAWQHSLSSALCSTWRLPHSLWHTAEDNIQFNPTIKAAAAACKHAPGLLLDSGTGRPSIPPAVWTGLLPQLKPWLTSGGPGVARHVRLHLRNPPSPTQLLVVRRLPWLHALRLQHSHSAVYSRHLQALAVMTQLQELELLMELPKLELRSLAHQRLRRVPLKADCLSRLVNLSRLEISCRAYTGDLLPDTLVAFSSPAALEAFSCLTHLSLSEAALPGPWPVEEWLRPLSHLKSLQFVLQDDPAACANRTGAAGSSSSATCSAGGVAASNAGLLGTGGLSAALAAAAQAAGSSRADQQLAVAQQNLLAGLQNLSSALQQAANSGAFGRVAGGSSGSSSHHTHHHHHHHTPHQLSPGGPSAGSSAGGAAPAAAAAATAGGGQIARTSSSTSTAEADTPSATDAAAAAAAVAAAAAASRPLLPVSFSSCCPGLSDLVLANLYGERLIQMAVPSGLTRLVLHLANPTPGTVNGEQLAAVVLQAADSLLSLELGLGMRFSLSGAVMRGLKRSLKQLRDLTLIEGAQDHLEGLGCWCNLPRLTLVEGRCTVPLRGLYELSMRAAMGRTPGVLRYHGHARHVEELASRLGAALQELRLDSLSGLGSGYRSGGGGGGHGSSGSGSSSPAGSPRAVKRQHQGAAADGEDDEGGSSAAGEVVGEQEAAPLPALAQLSCMTRLEVVGEQIGQLDAYGVLVLSNCKHLQVLAIEGHEPWLAADRGVKEQLEWLAELPQLRQLRLAGVMLGRSRLGAGSAGADSAAGRDAAADGSNGSGADGKSGKKGSGGGGRGSSAGGKAGVGSSSSGSGAAALPVPAVRGLGNGLGSGVPAKVPGGGGGRGPVDPEARAAAIAKARAEEEEGADDEAYEVAYTHLVCATAMQFQDMQLKAMTGQLPVGAGNSRVLAYQAAQQEARVAVCLEELRRCLCQMLPNCRVWLD